MFSNVQTVLALWWMLFNRNCVGTVNTATLVSFTHFPRRYRHISAYNEWQYLPPL